MFKSIKHEYSINGKCALRIPKNGFCVKLFITGNNQSLQTHMILTTIHVLESSYIQTDIIFNKNSKGTVNKKLHNVHKSIYFPKNASFVTYQYFFLFITLEKNNRFVFIGEHKFAKINVKFISIDSFCHDKYVFDIEDTLIK